MKVRKSATAKSQLMWKRKITTTRKKSKMIIPKVLSTDMALGKTRCQLTNLSEIAKSCGAGTSTQDIYSNALVLSVATKNLTISVKFTRKLI